MHGTMNIKFIYCSVVHRMRNVADNSCGENQNKPFVFNIFFFEKRAIYKIISKKIL